MTNNVGANLSCDLWLLDCQDQWNQIELGLLVIALFVVNLTTMCLANEIHWAHSESRSSLATFTCASCNVADFFSDFNKSPCCYVLGTCIGFIWFHSNIHLNITQHAHPAEDEAQVTLIVVITVIVAIAGQTSYMMTSTQFSRISLEFFIRSSHGTTSFKPLSMYCVIMKQFQLLETALEDTILLIGPHGFDSFLLWVGGQVVSSPSC